MEGATVNFYPSEIARVVLGYLKIEGYNSTFKTFLKECPHLQECVSLLKKGFECRLTLKGLTLTQILDDYATLKSSDLSQKTSQPDLDALWRQVDNVLKCIKDKSTLRSCQSVMQRSRTRNLQIKKQREQALDKNVSSTLVAQQEANYELPDEGSNSSHTETDKVKGSGECLDCGYMEKEPSKGDNSCLEKNDQGCLPPSGHRNVQEDKNLNHFQPIAVESQSIQSNLSVHCPSEQAQHRPILSPSPLNQPSLCSQSNVSPTVCDTIDMTTPPSQVDVHHSAKEGVSLEAETVIDINITPVGDARHFLVTPPCVTPTKLDQSAQVEPHGDKRSPRRKRPPRKKSAVEKSCQNENSNSSNNSSLTDPSLPQLMQQIMNNPEFPRKLAANINRSLHPESDPAVVQEETEELKIPPTPELNLDAILDAHEPQMTTEQINGIIGMTANDPVFDSFFSLFGRMDSLGSDTDLPDHKNLLEDTQLSGEIKPPIAHDGQVPIIGDNTLKVDVSSPIPALDLSEEKEQNILVIQEDEQEEVTSQTPSKEKPSLTALKNDTFTSPVIEGSSRHLVSTISSPHGFPVLSIADGEVDQERGDFLSILEGDGGKINVSVNSEKGDEAVAESSLGSFRQQQARSTPGALQTVSLQSLIQNCNQRAENTVQRKRKEKQSKKKPEDKKPKPLKEDSKAKRRIQEKTSKGVNQGNRDRESTCNKIRHQQAPKAGWSPEFKALISMVSPSKTNKKNEDKEVEHSKSLAQRDAGSEKKPRMGYVSVVEVNSLSDFPDSSSLVPIHLERVLTPEVKGSPVKDYLSMPVFSCSPNQKGCLNSRLENSPSSSQLELERPEKALSRPFSSKHDFLDSPPNQVLSEGCSASAEDCIAHASQVSLTESIENQQSHPVSKAADTNSNGKNTGKSKHTPRKGKSKHTPRKGKSRSSESSQNHTKSPVACDHRLINLDLRESVDALVRGEVRMDSLKTPVLHQSTKKIHVRSLDFSNSSDLKTKSQRQNTANKRTDNKTASQKESVRSSITSIDSFCEMSDKQGSESNDHQDHHRINPRRSQRLVNLEEKRTKNSTPEYPDSELPVGTKDLVGDTPQTDHRLLEAIQSSSKRRKRKICQKSDSKLNVHVETKKSKTELDSVYLETNESLMSLDTHAEQFRLVQEQVSMETQEANIAKMAGNQTTEHQNVTSAISSDKYIPVTICSWEKQDFSHNQSDSIHTNQRPFETDRSHLTSVNHKVSVTGVSSDCHVTSFPSGGHMTSVHHVTSDPSCQPQCNKDLNESQTRHCVNQQDKVSLLPLQETVEMNDGVTFHNNQKNASSGVEKPVVGHTSTQSGREQDFISENFTPTETAPSLYVPDIPTSLQEPKLTQTGTISVSQNATSTLTTMSQIPTSTSHLSSSCISTIEHLSTAMPMPVCVPASTQTLTSSHISTSTHIATSFHMPTTTHISTPQMSTPTCASMPVSCVPTFTHSSTSSQITAPLPMPFSPNKSTKANMLIAHVPSSKVDNLVRPGLMNHLTESSHGFDVSFPDKLEVPTDTCIEMDNTQDFWANVEKAVKSLTSKPSKSDLSSNSNKSLLGHGLTLKSTSAASVVGHSSSLTTCSASESWTSASCAPLVPVLSPQTPMPNIHIDPDALGFPATPEAAQGSIIGSASKKQNTRDCPSSSSTPYVDNRIKSLGIYSLQGGENVENLQEDFKMEGKNKKDKHDQEEEIVTKKKGDMLSKLVRAVILEETNLSLLEPPPSTDVSNNNDSPRKSSPLSDIGTIDPVTPVDPNLNDCIPDCTGNIYFTTKLPGMKKTEITQFKTSRDTRKEKRNSRRSSKVSESSTTSIKDSDTEEKTETKLKTRRNKKESSRNKISRDHAALSPQCDDGVKAQNALGKITSCLDATDPKTPTKKKSRNVNSRDLYPVSYSSNISVTTKLTNGSVVSPLVNSSIHGPSCGEDVSQKIMEQPILSPTSLGQEKRDISKDHRQAMKPVSIDSDHCHKPVFHMSEEQEQHTTSQNTNVCSTNSLLSKVSCDTAKVDNHHEEEEEIDIEGDWDGPWSNLSPVGPPAPVFIPTIRPSPGEITISHDGTKSLRPMNGKEVKNLQSPECFSNSSFDSICHTLESSMPSSKANTEVKKPLLVSYDGSVISPPKARVTREPRRVNFVTLSKNVTSKTSGTLFQNKHDFFSDSNSSGPPSVKAPNLSQVHSCHLTVSKKENQNNGDKKPFSTPTKGEKKELPNYMQYVTPPKKRITASIYHGDSAYFDSERFSGLGPSQTTAKSSQQFQEVDSPLTASTPLGAQNKSISSPKSDKSLSKSKEQSRPNANSAKNSSTDSSKKHDRSASTKQESSYQKVNSKSKKGKKNKLDLTNLDVDKVLSKIYQ